MVDQQRIRYGPNEVLDQVETRNRVWNPDTLQWESESVLSVDADGHLQIDVLSAASTAVTGPLTDAELRASDVIVSLDSESVAVITKTPLTASAPAAASVGVVSAQAVAVNANRKGLHLVNTSENYISIGIGAAAVLYSGITLTPLGGSFWMDEYSYSTGAINAIASGAASNLGVQELV